MAGALTDSLSYGVRLLPNMQLSCQASFSEGSAASTPRSRAPTPRSTPRTTPLEAPIVPKLAIEPQALHTYTVVFAKPGPLGIGMRLNKANCAEIDKPPSGQAAMLGIAMHDVVAAVEGQDCHGLTPEQVKQLIVAQGRPLQMSFERIVESIQVKEEEQKSVAANALLAAMRGDSSDEEAATPKTSTGGVAEVEKAKKALLAAMDSSDEEAATPKSSTGDKAKNSLLAAMDRDSSEDSLDQLLGEGSGMEGDREAGRRGKRGMQGTRQVGLAHCVWWQHS